MRETMDETTTAFLVLVRRALENEPSKAASGVWAACLMSLAHQDCRSAAQWLREFITDELADVGTGESAREEKPGNVGSLVPTQVGG
jgi:hypothetical protein